MSTTEDLQDLANQAAALDEALEDALGWANHLAAHQTDPEAERAYRWLAAQLDELRDDAATIGGLSR